MKSTLLYVYHRQANELVDYAVLSSRVGDRYQRLAHQVNLLLLVAEGAHRRSWMQRICDRIQHCGQWLYRELGLEQLDEWLIKQVFFPEQVSIGPWINAVTGLLLINTVLDELKPITWTLLVHITKAAAPHMGTTAFTLLNHTVQLWTAIRSGLEK